MSLPESSRRAQERRSLPAPAAPEASPWAVGLRSRLAALMARPTVDLLEVSLVIAAEEYPDLDMPRYVRIIDTLGDTIAKRAGAILNPFARLEALREFLFDEQGFRGNNEQYDDRRNSYMNDVIDRKVGIPLTLSLLYIEVARRAGFDARGVGLPGHFVVRVIEQGRDLLVDPFHGGRIITPEDCRDLVTRTTGRGSLFKQDVLRGASARTTVSRLLLNLKRIHLAQGDYARALSVVERLLVVNPGDPREIRDRGLLLAHLGHTASAVSDLEAYLQLAPEASDADSVRGRLAWILRKLAEVH